jgi:hypothetical protein
MEQNIHWFDRNSATSTFAATQTMSMPLGQIAPPSAVTALGLKITCSSEATK